jgi:hypothetical protein
MIGAWSLYVWAGGDTTVDAPIRHTGLSLTAAWALAATYGGGLLSNRRAVQAGTAVGHARSRFAALSGESVRADQVILRRSRSRATYVRYLAVRMSNWDFRTPNRSERGPDLGRGPDRIESCHR